MDQEEVLRQERMRFGPAPELYHGRGFGFAQINLLEMKTANTSFRLDGHMIRLRHKKDDKATEDALDEADGLFAAVYQEFSSNSGLEKFASLAPDFQPDQARGLHAEHHHDNHAHAEHDDHGDHGDHGHGGHEHTPEGHQEDEAETPVVSTEQHSEGSSPSKMPTGWDGTVLQNGWAEQMESVN